MAERRLHGLQRVLGVNARSSTAYGKVGSSIDYTLRGRAIVIPLPPRVIIESDGANA